MMQGNSRSKIVHYKKCVYKKRIAEHNIIELDSIDAAKAMGYRVCKCCTPVSKVAKRESVAIKEYCSNHDINYFIEDNQVQIKGPSSEWIFTINCENKATLYHRNTCGDTSAYHKQNFKEKSLLSALKYIVEHDAYRKANPIKKPVRVAKAYTDPFYYFFGQTSQSMIDSKPVKKNGNWVRIKGTKKYNKKLKREKEQKRRDGIRTVLALIDGLSTAY